jgi:hypothetical protein
MHKTRSGEKRKALLQKARDLEREAKILARGKKTRPATKAQTGAAELKTQAEALVLEARLEDLTVRVVEMVKTTKKGSKAYTYWTASWRESGKVHNVHLGSTRKLSRQAAMKKARKMKEKALKPELEEQFHPGRHSSLFLLD